MTNQMQINNGLILFQFLGPNRMIYKEDLDSRNEHLLLLRKWFEDNNFKSEPLKKQSLKDVKAIYFFETQSVYPIFGNIYDKIRFIIYNKLRKDTSSRNIFKEEHENKYNIKKYLIAFEPKLICPLNFKKTYSSLFDNVFSWSEKCCGGECKYTKINLPIPVLDQTIKNPIPFNQRKALVTISSNKGYYNKSSLCTFKYKSYEALSKYLGNDFDLYGFMWNQSFLMWLLKFIRGRKSKFFFHSPKYYKGVISNKYKVLVNYKFCLVVENTREKSLISEKIFHSLYAGCIPLYLGAPNIENHIPKECYIDISQFTDMKSLSKYLQEFKESDYNIFLEARNHFLKSDKYSVFTSKEFVKRVTSVFQNDFFTESLEKKLA